MNGVPSWRTRQCVVEVVTYRSADWPLATGAVIKAVEGGGVWGSSVEQVLCGAMKVHKRTVLGKASPGCRHLHLSVQETQRKSCMNFRSSLIEYSFFPSYEGLLDSNYTLT